MSGVCPVSAEAKHIYNDYDVPGAGIRDGQLVTEYSLLLTGQARDKNSLPKVFTYFKNPYGTVVFEYSSEDAPVKLQSLARVELTFIGGRLIAIQPFDREDVIYDTLRKKYNVKNISDPSGKCISDGSRSFCVIEVDGKECFISPTQTEYKGAIINLPYARALLKDLINRAEYEKNKNEAVKKGELDNI